jgi:glycosyltransferase involved in cell wall biosynthesis
VNTSKAAWPRVLAVTAMYPSPAAPYQGIFVHEQIVALRELGAHIDVLYIEGRRGKHEYLRGCLRVAAACARRQYDVVHGHYGYAGLVARCQLAAPVVVTFYGSDINLQHERPFSKLAAALANETIVLSPVLARVGGLARAHVIPCGVDLSTFRPMEVTEARRALGIDADATVLLFPADPARRVKRFDRFQAAISRLEEPVHVLTLHDVPREQVPLVLNAADCLVMTSDSEGSPVSVREALACNTPIVSVDVGDVRELLEGVEHSHVVSFEPDAIAAAVRRVLAGRNRSNGRQKAPFLDADVSAKRVYDLYTRLATMPRRGSLVRAHP